MGVSKYFKDAGFAYCKVCQHVCISADMINLTCGRIDCVETFKRVNDFLRNNRTEMLKFRTDGFDRCLICGHVYKVNQNTQFLCKHHNCFMTYDRIKRYVIQQNKFEQKED